MPSAMFTPEFWCEMLANATVTGSMFGATTTLSHSSDYRFLKRWMKTYRLILRFCDMGFAYLLG
jgi:hypothetical protein